MLIEIWERLRGYDKWIQAEAAVNSWKVEKVFLRRAKGGARIYGWVGKGQIEWIDQTGVRHSQSVQLSKGTLVFKMHGLSPIVIRYDPVSPSIFYLREHLRYRVNNIAQVIIGVFVLIAIAAAILRT